jgi:hypothetical protein
VRAAQACLAHAIKIEALSRIGELLKAMPKAKGRLAGRTKGSNKGVGGSLREPPTATYRDLGI